MFEFESLQVIAENNIQKQTVFKNLVTDILLKI